MALGSKSLVGFFFHKWRQFYVRKFSGKTLLIVGVMFAMEIFFGALGK